MAPSQLAQLKAALSGAGLNRISTPKNKNKKKQRGSQEVDRAKKAAKLDEIRRSLNKFDEREAKLKHDVGGRNLKGVKGAPSASRSAGLEQRRKTLLPEHHLEGHRGTFVDRRFGEADPTMSLDDRMLERYTRERQRGQGRRGMFNIEDDDDVFGDLDDGAALGGLTHGGRSVMDLPGDDFEAQGFGEDDEDEDGGGRGAIDRRTVARAHFGGFDEEDDGDEPRKKSKQEVMSEIIAKSKEHKFERQQQKEDDATLREELDGGLDELRELLGGSAPLRPAAVIPGPSRTTGAARGAPAADDADYDQYVRTLAFDARAKPKDRTKSEDELALEEKERLEAAEAKRLKRMRGEDDDEEEEEEQGRGKKGRKGKAAAVGADDLDDDFLGEVDEDGAVGLLGKGLTREDIENMGVDQEGSEGEQGDSEEEDGESGEEDEEDDEDEEEDEDEDDDEDEDEDEVEPSDMEDLVDDAELSDADDDDDEPAPTLARKGKAAQKSAAPKEIPYTFPCPATVDELEDLLDGLDDDALSTVVQRIRSLHHPSLAQGNKDKLQNFLGVLLDYIVILASRPTPSLPLIATLAPHVAALVKLNPLAASAHFVAKLALMQKNLVRGLARGPARADARTLPGAPELVLLRLVGTAWSTSDYAHPVAQPAVLLIGQYLSQSRVRRTADLASGLFLCSLVAQYEAMSKRVVPEAVNFVAATLRAMLPRRKDAAAGNAYPDLVVPGADVRIAGTAEPAARADLVAALADDTQQARADVLSVALRLVPALSALYASSDAFVELFAPVLDILNAARVAKLAPGLQAQHAAAAAALGRQLGFARAARAAAPLALQSHKPVAIPTFAPRFEDDFAPERHYDPDVERAAASKLRAQYKKERKGAIRELRKDNRFLAGEKAREQRAKDDEYSRKMRRVEGEITSERAEEKAMEREKQRDKRRAGRR